MSLLDEAREAIRSRLNHSVVGGAAIGWSLANWKVFVHAFSAGEAAAKVKAMEDAMSLDRGVAGLAIGAGLALGAPWLAALATWATAKATRYIASHESDITAMRLQDQARLQEMRQSELDALEVTTKKNREAVAEELKRLEGILTDKHDKVHRAESEVAKLAESKRAADESAAKSKAEVERIGRLLFLTKHAEELEKAIIDRALRLLARVDIGVPPVTAKVMIESLRRTAEKTPGLVSDATLALVDTIAAEVVKPRRGATDGAGLRAALKSLRVLLETGQKDDPHIPGSNGGSLPVS